MTTTPEGLTSHRWARLARALSRRARAHIGSPVAIGAIVLVVALLVGVGAIAMHDRTRGDGFSVARWELSTFANRWLYHLGEPLRDDPEPDAAVAAYFALDDRTTREAERLENVVEATIEGRIDAVARGFGLDDPPGPLLGGWLGPAALFPPVDVEFELAPRVLVRSPRDEIRRLSTRLLRPGIDSASAAALETAAERDGDVSALVVQTGGVATYPAVVMPRSTYAATVEIAAHEWLHHYLSPYPLGRSYFGSDSAQTINETVADIVAEEIAAAVLSRFGDPTATPTAVASPASAPPATAPVDRDRVLRELRVEVEALLAAGEVATAEQRMAETGADLREQGINLGRINQAFFAWFGTYANRGDAIDPLGGQLRALRAGSADLGAFVRLVRGLDSRAGIAAALDAVGSG